MQQPNKQSGSLLGYLLVAGVLTALLVGGLFWVQRYKMAVDTPQIVATQDEKNNSAQSDAGKSENGDKDKAAEKATPTPDVSDEPAATTDSEPADDDSDAVGTSEGADELPTTGPAETAASLVAVTALAYALVLYTRSRRI